MNNVSRQCKECPNSKYHVLEIRGLKFCNGCFANSVFLGLLLPIYLMILVDFPTKFILPILISYALVNIILFISTLYNRSTSYLRISYFLISVFLIASHIMILYFPLKYTFNFGLLSTMIFILSTPQFSMYFWKITTSTEFRYPKSKFMIRMSFIHAYLLAVIMLNQNLVIALCTIIITASSFVALRQYSALKVQQSSSINAVTNDFSVNIRTSIQIIASNLYNNIRTSNALKFDEAAEGDLEECCTCCCGCCTCIICCATCGVCGDLEHYTPVDAGFE